MTIMEKEIREQPEVLEKCWSNNIELINEIVETMKERCISNVFIAARGTSDHAGIYGKYVFEILCGLPVALAAPSVFTLYNSTVNFTNSLVIGISQSGEAEDVKEVLASATKQGAISIAITNFPKSPLALNAKYHLDCSAGLEKSVAATKTFTAQMYLLGLLATSFANNCEVLEGFKQLPNNIKRVFGLENKIQQIAGRFRYMNECFVLARGTNYSVAMETALKIQETSYVRAKAYAVSDFYHGPFAMLDINIPVFIIAPEGESFKDMTEMVEKLGEKGIELIIISNNKNILKKAKVALELPKEINDVYSPFYNAIIAQILACNISLNKGLNPDSPRDLSKVTITR